jgi:hypothetical protein
MKIYRVEDAKFTIFHQDGQWVLCRVQSVNNYWEVKRFRFEQDAIAYINSMRMVQ